MKSTMTSIQSGVRRGARLALVSLLGALVTLSESALALNLSDAPPYLITAVEPNVLLTFDDSGSMARAYLPDNISGNSGTQRACSSEFNGMYFNPTVTYYPPVDANGNSYPNANFSGAWVDGYRPTTNFTRPDGTSGSTVDLNSRYRPSWSNLTNYVGCTLALGAAFYYNYNTVCGNPNSDTCYTLVRPIPAAQQQNFANWYSYYRNRNLAAKTSAGRAFARFGTNVRVMGMHLNSSGGSTGPSAPIFPNNSTTTFMRRFCDDASGTDPNCPNGTARSDFFQRLYNSPNNSGTPLRQAMMRAGEHFGTANTGSNSAYRDVPGTAGSPERSCRLNFHIMMTDGYWNGNAGIGGNQDGSAQTLPDGNAYAPNTTDTYIYSDAWGSAAEGTLADNAFYYWYRDLRPDLTNNVDPYFADTGGTTVQNYWNPLNDPANWQHMRTYTIGLGIDGTLPNDTGTYNALRNRTTCTTIGGATVNPCVWQNPMDAENGDRIDDLWHAAINGRGRYFSVRDPGALVSAFTSIIADISSTTSTASAAAVNAGTVSSTNSIFLSRFNLGTSTGQLLAYTINPSTLTYSYQWDASQELATQDYNARTILTYKPSNGRGIPFRWPTDPTAPGPAELDTSQSTLLKYHPISGLTDTDTVGEARLDYLRGDASNEGAGLNFRTRNRICPGGGACPPSSNTGVLGDTVNSSPLYVGAPRLPYPDTYEPSTSTPYSQFKSDYASRTPIVYVGANDGMLHGFNANNGREVLAYVPSKVYPYLSRLAHQPYAHKYFVDGDMFATDVAIQRTPSGPKEWRTILVGSLRHGGQGIYALDITDPAQFTETPSSNPESVVLWEFTDTHDPDLGYTYSKPTITRMKNGKWAVIFGNGYNNSVSSTLQPEIDTGTTVSATGQAALYILFIEDGIGQNGTWPASAFVKIPVPGGSVGQPNGLASPAVADIDGDGTADYIFAGDLNGEMWQFDVTSSTASDWSNTANFRSIFTARDASGNRQPITARPAVGFHPTSLSGLMVYFGTGKYIETTDASIVGATTQTFYGIWNQQGSVSPVSTPTRGDLLKQEFLGTAFGSDARTTTDYPISWRDGVPPPTPSHIGWYLDLPTPGERVFTNALLRDDHLLFTTAIPSDDPCLTGGSGWLMCLNPANGGRPTPCLDPSGDGTVNAADQVTVAGQTGQNVSGARTDGIQASPTMIIGTGSERVVVENDPNNPRLKRAAGEGQRRGSWSQKK